MPRGGKRPGAGRKPGSTTAALAALSRVTLAENNTATELLNEIKYREQIKKIFRSHGNYATKARLVMYLMDKATGRAFVATNPQQGKQMLTDPRMQAAINELLPRRAIGPKQDPPKTQPEADKTKIM